jgi:hypothetical protein
MSRPAMRCSSARARVWPGVPPHRDSSLRLGAERLRSGWACAFALKHLDPRSF